jgi:electron transfer flavoprotein alpha/beta subunit
MPIPWAAILTHGPSLVAAARSLLANQATKATAGNDRNQNVGTRLDQLETGAAESARLLQAMAEQLQALTLAEQETRKRLRMALALGVVATLLAAGAVLLALAT